MSIIIQSKDPTKAWTSAFKLSRNLQDWVI